MTHKSSHIIIHKAQAFLTAPIPGGGKRWHVALLSLLSGFTGGWFF